MNSLNALGLALFVLSVAAAPQTKPVTVQLPGQGILEGSQVIMSRNQKVSIFLGIPFAAPPVGKLRFAPPQTEPLVSWTGTRSAASPSPSCMQHPPDLTTLDKLGFISKLYPNSPLTFQEDCLYLNVYVPDGPFTRGQDGWPVVIYFHSTDFSSGSPYMVDPTIFALRNKVIVVVPAFRLNIFGFLSTGDGYSQGNFGLMDQAAAIVWVQRSISRFNGTASDVTLMGHGGGGVSVTLHMVCEGSGFQRAMALSGSALQPGAVKAHDPKILDELASTFECDRTPHSNLMACLRNAPLSYLLGKANDLGPWGPTFDADLPNVTSPFIPDEPEALLAAGKFTKVPFLTGFVESEESHTLPSDLAVTDEFFLTSLRTTVMKENFGLVDNESKCILDEELLNSAVEFYYAPSRLSDHVHLREKLVEFYTDKNYGSGIFKTAELVSKYAPTYAYRFDYKMKTLILDKKENHAYLSHQSELPFVWGMPYWATVTPPILWNSADRKVAEQMMLLFFNFIKYPNPEIKTQPVSWSKFSMEQPRFLIVSKDMFMGDTSVIDYKSFSFWNEFYPRVREAALVCCNATDDAYFSTYNSVLITVSSFYCVFYSPAYLFDINLI